MRVLQDMVIGSVAGVAATVPMTAVMLLVHRSLPGRERSGLPPQHIMENLTRRLGVNRHLSDDDRAGLATVAHFSYGSSAGAVYAPIASRTPVPYVVSGTAFGLLVWAGSYMGFLPAVGMYASPSGDANRRTAMMVAAHLIWGATLGLGVQALQRLFAVPPPTPPAPSRKGSAVHG